MDVSIHLYPVREGFLTPLDVHRRIRAAEKEKRGVVIVSADPEYGKLEGAIVVPQIGDAWNVLLEREPGMVVVDSLDLSDPDGLELAVHPAGLHGPSLPLPAEWLDRLLEWFVDGRTGVREAILIGFGDEISAAWQKRLKSRDVHIRWLLGASEPWRTWSIGKSRLSSGQRGDVRMPDDCGDGMNGRRFECDVRSERSRNLLGVVGEFSDLFFHEDARRVPHLDRSHESPIPQRLLTRLLGGGSLEERIGRTGRLVEDLRAITRAVEIRETALRQARERTSHGMSAETLPPLPSTAEVH